METRARRGMALTALLATSVLVLLSGAPAANAEGDVPVTQTPATAAATGQVIGASTPEPSRPHSSDRQVASSVCGRGS